VENNKKIILLFSIICIFDITKYSNPIEPPILYYILIYICAAIFTYLGFSEKEFKNIPPISKKIFIIYLFYNIFTILFGLINSEGYWDYKNIFILHIPPLFVCFAILIGARFEKNLPLFSFVIKRIFPLAIIIALLFLLFFSETKYYHSASKLASPIYFFILAFPFIKNNHKILVIFISIMSLYIDPNWRTNILTLVVIWIFVIFYYLSFLKKKLLNFLGIITLILPLVLLYNAYYGKMDVFQTLSKSNISPRNAIDVQNLNMVANTRTFLYLEVFDSIKNKNTNILIGGGAASGYQTFSFQDDKVSKFTDRERFTSEVRFLNTMNKSGLIGVTLEFLIIFVTAFFAINKSNNNLSKLFGLFLIFSWILYFIQMPLELSNLYFFYYLIIGLCLNQQFRDSTDKQITLFFKSL
jgi:hypothetical protein